MNYELAKELKEAGFPFRGPFYEEEVSDNPYYKEFYPALSELIEACGDEFNELKYWFEHRVGEFEVHKEWRAQSKTRFLNWSVGSTPEEAVAKLWLALNKS